MTNETETETERQEAETAAAETAAAETAAAETAAAETLEAERDFLLRSLDDLEAEREAGNLDDEQYRRLHDDYTARAATVLRALESGEAPAPPPGAAPRPTARRRFLVACALVGVALVAAATLVSQLGDRAPGQTATGNQQLSPAPKLDDLRRAVAERPDDALAHRELGQALVSAGDVSGAIQALDTAAKLDPADAEASAYGGWMVFLASRAAGDGLGAEDSADLLEGALRRLDAAVAAQPDYPDARFFRGMVLLRGKNDPAAAIPELERFVALVPEGPQTEQVKGLLESARAQVGGGNG